MEIFCHFKFCHNRRNHLWYQKHQNCNLCTYSRVGNAMPSPHENPWNGQNFLKYNFHIAISSFARIEEITCDIGNTTIVSYLFKIRKCDAIATWKPLWIFHVRCIQFPICKWKCFAISSFAITEEITYDIRNTTIVTYLFKSRKCDAIATWKPPWNGHNFWPKCNFQVPRLTSALNQGEIWHQHPAEMQPYKNDNNQSIHIGFETIFQVAC